MRRVGQTFECNGCGARQHVNPYDFKWVKGAPEYPGSQCERILASYYSWETVRPAGGPKQTHLARDPGNHVCPNCRAIPDNVIPFQPGRRTA